MAQNANVMRCLLPSFLCRRPARHPQPSYTPRKPRRLFPKKVPRHSKNTQRHRRPRRLYPQTLSKNFQDIPRHSKNTQRHSLKFKQTSLGFNLHPGTGRLHGCFHEYPHPASLTSDCTSKQQKCKTKGNKSQTVPKLTAVTSHPTALQN